MDPDQSALPTIPDVRGDAVSTSAGGRASSPYPSRYRPPVGVLAVERCEATLPTLEMIAMRNRHEARLCHGCHASMAGQTDRCRRCGADFGARAARRRQASLREQTTGVLEARARRDDDSNRRNRPPATRAPAAMAPKEA